MPGKSTLPMAVMSLTWTGFIRRDWEGPIMWHLKLQTFITSLLKNESGANAVEYALIMALVAVFIIAAVILMATEIGVLFNHMAECLSDAVNCTSGTFTTP